MPRSHYSDLPPRDQLEMQLPPAWRAPSGPFRSAAPPPAPLSSPTISGPLPGAGAPTLPTALSHHSVLQGPLPCPKEAPGAHVRTPDPGSPPSGRPPTGPPHPHCPLSAQGHCSGLTAPTVMCSSPLCTWAVLLAVGRVPRGRESPYPAACPCPILAFAAGGRVPWGRESPRPAACPWPSWGFPLTSTDMHRSPFPWEPTVWHQDAPTMVPSPS